MFIGHYGIAFALKKYAPKTSLGVLFIAAQLADIAFFILVPLGIEHLRIIPGFTEASPFDLYDYQSRIAFLEPLHGLLLHIL